MRTPLEVTFSKSTSVHFPLALKLAESLPGFRSAGEGNARTYSVSCASTLADEPTWTKLGELLALVVNWHSTTVSIAGQPARPWMLHGQLQQIQICYRMRCGNLDTYCSGKQTPTSEPEHFGCRKCLGISRGLNVRTGYPHGAWYQYGSLAPGLESFRVDKQAILKVLEAQVSSDAVIFCPAYRWERVRANVNALPDVIALGKDSRFEVHYSPIDAKRPLGIRPKRALWESSGSTIQIGVRDRTQMEEPASKRDIPKIRYADVAGQTQALAVLRSVVELPLTHERYFEALGVEPQAGILLYGPPGNGKTLLAKAVAGESAAHLELINGPEVLSKWVGQSGENLRRVFARAKQFAPSVVLIDELDAIAPRREILSQQHDVQLIAQLLVLLDGLEARGRVAVVATTNRLEAIDPAVCRPGRFDYLVQVSCPDRRGRAAILGVHLGKLKTSSGVAVKDLSLRTAGFSGAELAALCRQAGLDAVRRGIAGKIPTHRLRITSHDLDQALQSLRANRGMKQS